MEFNTSFSWLGALDSGSRDDIASGKAELVWDVAVSQDDWVVLGRKKGQYIAEVSRVLRHHFNLPCSVPLCPRKQHRFRFRVTYIQANSNQSQQPLTLGGQTHNARTRPCPRPTGPPIPAGSARTARPYRNLIGQPNIGSEYRDSQNA